MKELLEILEQKFDDYHREELKRFGIPDAEYYLYMGKANAIGEIIDLIEIIEKKINYKK